MHGKIHVYYVRHGIAESRGFEDSVVLVIKPLSALPGIQRAVELFLHKDSGYTRFFDTLISKEGECVCSVVLEGRGGCNV